MEKRIMTICLVVVGLALAGCGAGAKVSKDGPDPAGVYTLVTVDGLEMPATVSHGGEVVVHSGVFTIKADGTCKSETVFGPPSGNKSTRTVSATYTQNGSRLNMKWEGAGRNYGTVEGDTFTMYNEGMVFLYKK